MPLLTQPAGPGAFRTLAPLVLASASPRRRELLGSLGLGFSIDPGEAEEPRPEPGEAPADYALRAARAKALPVAAAHPEAVILAADTIVVLDQDILGKPRDAADACAMLARLSGRIHQVVTGCCLVRPQGGEKCFAVSSDVTMRRSHQAELAAYAATGEPLDKAGAYAIQGLGGFLVRRVEGSYTNVVGLPLSRVLEVLLEWAVAAPRPGTPDRAAG